MKKILLIMLFIANLSASVEDNQKACNDGDGNTCLQLGILYHNGQGVTKDYDKAREYYIKACDIGNTKGCYNLGIMYKSGQGVKQDYTKAVKYYTKSCDGGDPWGCRNLGVQYFTGTGVKQDYKKASELYTKACNSGYTDACGNLGFMYEKGAGVNQDYKKASELYTKSCDGGNAVVCSSLALLYLDGLGVEKDESKALELIKKSCDGGNKQACEAYSEYIAVIKEDASNFPKPSKVTDKPKFYKENMDGLSYCSATYFVRSATPYVIKDQSKVYSSYGQMTGFIAGVYYKKIFNRVASNGDISKLREKYFESLEKEYRKNKTLLPKTLEKIAQCDSLLLYMYNNPQLSTALKNAKRGTLEDESLLLDALSVTTKKPVEINKEYILESFKMWIDDHNAMTPLKKRNQLKEQLKK